MKSSKRRKQPDWAIAILLPSVWQRKRERKPSTREIDQYKANLNIDYDQVIVPVTLDNLLSDQSIMHQAVNYPLDRTKDQGRCEACNRKQVMNYLREVNCLREPTFNQWLTNGADCRLHYIITLKWGSVSIPVYSVSGTKWNQQVYITMSQAIQLLALIHQNQQVHLAEIQRPNRCWIGPPRDCTSYYTTK